MIAIRPKTIVVKTMIIPIPFTIVAIQTTSFVATTIVLSHNMQ